MYHLLLLDSLAHGFWAMAYGLIGINWVMTSTMKDELWAWKDLGNRKKCWDWFLWILFE